MEGYLFVLFELGVLSLLWNILFYIVNMSLIRRLNVCLHNYPLEGFDRIGSSPPFLASSCHWKLVFTMYYSFASFEHVVDKKIGIPFLDS